ncbi:MAG: D-alanyl-D-alanine carboxypeptidase/D-alanyl-D-alanine-endopeptidase [Gammaproteobacteria bacterium RIFCSPHIGHO2_12_FULL_37_14]|nr:MAG: D-alanyl-D-alanine carboxypeptidase/D-alanyl-D-alanine-endopeptidase [Gammaproteobacteria bacterium RIFCSPHIGHO2_12_FULL_37_14]
MKLVHYLFLLGMILLLNNIALGKRYRSKPVPITFSTVYGISQLNSELNQLISANLANADISVYVKSMKYGDMLYARNIHQPLTPASTLKIFTAEAALLYLSPEYRFSTQLLTDAKSVKNGILQGNLYIVLSGDPTLTYYDLVDLMLSLKTQQIRAVAGNVYIDNTAYDQRFYGPGWVWKDTNYCYAAPISASIINHNCLSFKVTPSKIPGRAAQVVTSPKYFYPPIRNSVITKTKKTRSCSVRLTGDTSSIISIDGCMPRGKYAWGVSYVVADIPEYNRALFKNLLNRLSVNVYGNVTFGSASNNLSLIGAHNSKPLRLLINDMLKKSDNIIAGALFKKLGQLYTREPGSWENGSFAVSQILAKRAGVNITGMRVLDGSGLSPDNLATSAQMMQVLDFAFHHYATSYEFISALPIAGVDGTLKHRMGYIARKVRAKTGTISGVASLAGYTVTAEKEPLAFVIMINGSKGMGWRYKALEDKMTTTLTRYVRNTNSR